MKLLYTSLVLRATNFSGSGWQTRKQGHWTGNFGTLYLLPQEAIKNKKKLIELIRDKEDKAIFRCVDGVSVCIYNELLL